jgi:uncharacterized peroxidase-related enzyme
MTTFTIHTPDTAPAGAKDALATIRDTWKFVPNLHGMLAESPPALEAYDTLFGLVEKTGLTPVERQVAFLAVSYENNCEYCMAGHSVLAKMAGVPAPTLAAIRDGQSIADPRLQALRRFVSRVVAQRGVVDAAEVDAFIAAGFTKANVLDVLLIAATKLLSNYTNHIAGTPNDAFMAQTAWQHPAHRVATAA